MLPVLISVTICSALRSLQAPVLQEIWYIFHNQGRVPAQLSCLHGVTSLIIVSSKTLVARQSSRYIDGDGDASKRTGAANVFRACSKVCGGELRRESYWRWRPYHLLYSIIFYIFRQFVCSFCYRCYTFRVVAEETLGKKLVWIVIIFSVLFLLPESEKLATVRKSSSWNSRLHVLFFPYAFLISIHEEFGMFVRVHMLFSLPWFLVCILPIYLWLTDIKLRFRKSYQNHFFLLDWRRNLYGVSILLFCKSKSQHCWPNMPFFSLS